MTVTLELLGAVFVTGILGGVHCVGMCGGIVCALAADASGRTPRWLLHVSYNLGRIASYGVAGALMGAVGNAALLLEGVLPIGLALYILANLALIALGLYLAGWWNVVHRLEPLGIWIWRRLQPFTGRFLPANTMPRALGLGLLWGWLPCALVYTVLATALLSGSALRGAAIMLAFGLGTLPNLLAAGLLYRRIRLLLTAKALRAVAGGLVLSFGIYGLANAATLTRHLKSGLLCF